MTVVGKEKGSSFYLNNKDLVVVTSCDIQSMLTKKNRKYVTFNQPEHFVCYFSMDNKCLKMTSTISWPVRFKELIENIRMLNNPENVKLQYGYIQIVDLETDPDSEAEAEAEIDAKGKSEAEAEAKAEAEAEAEEKAEAEAEAKAQAKVEAEVEAEAEAEAEEAEVEAESKENDTEGTSNLRNDKMNNDEFDFSNVPTDSDQNEQKKKRGRPKKSSSVQEDSNKNIDEPTKKRGRFLKSIDARPSKSSNNDDDFIDEDNVEDLPSSSKKSKRMKDNNVVPDCDFDDTVESYVYVGKTSKGIKYKDIIDRMVHFQRSNYALRALKLAVKETVDLEYTTSNRKKCRHPLVFTYMDIQKNQMFFYSIGFGYGSVGNNSFKAMKNANICNEPYKDTYYDSLDFYPYQLYAYFTSIGIYVPMLKNLPEYKGVQYEEECDDSEESWEIKSIRNMIFHRPDDEDTAPSVMVLIDWEVSANVGVFAEDPDDNSVLSWTAFHNLKDYNMLACYLKYRAKGIEGTEKILTRFSTATMTDEQAYLRRKKNNSDEEMEED